MSSIYKKILVTGGSGLVGNAIKNTFSEKVWSKTLIHSENTFLEKVWSKNRPKTGQTDNYEFIYISSKDYNLEDMNDTIRMFEEIKPNYVIHLAANVGGLFKNMNHKIEMFENNIIINYNVLRCCHKYNIEKCISFLSTCIFPDDIKYPIDETMLHLGPPHFSNDAYAYSKRMLEIHSKIYREQYGNNFMCIIPTNIYGKYDNFNLDNAHVIPALIHNCYLSKLKGEKFIVKGSGKPLRQFIYSEDLADITLYILFNDIKIDNVIVSPKDEISINEVAHIIAKEFNYEHMIEFDEKYSDGQYKKTANNDKLISLIDNYKFTDIKDGIKETIKWFIDNYKNVRK